MAAEIKDWIVRYYDKKDNLIGSHIIKERTENEAENEAIADMPLNCEDWTMVENKPMSDSMRNVQADIEALDSWKNC
jgi:hypothetical protein